MKFAMPLGKTLEVIPSRELTLDEEDYGPEEEIDGVVWRIVWDDKLLPWNTKTQLQATAIAMGCQWGACEMAKMLTDV
jgi:hypothetical protein